MGFQGDISHADEVGPVPVGDRAATILRYAVIILWLAAVTAMLVTDVWDESRSLNWVEDHSFLELVASNWKPPGAGKVVLFRPLPMALATAVAEMIDDFEAAWRTLRMLNAFLILLGLAFAVSFLRRVREPDRSRELIFTMAILWSGSAVICAGWFANIFDVGVFVLMMLGLRILSSDDGVRAGLVFGVAFFCKEVAVLVFPLLGILLWTKTTARRQTLKALEWSSALFVVYLILRIVVVTPGVATDLREFSVGGVIAACYRLPETLWWQVADVPIRWVGILVTIAAIWLLRSTPARVGALAVVAVSAAIYGQIVHLGPTPLLNPDNFIGRLYLVPAALILLLLTLFGRRWAVALVLVPLMWGALVTADRHVRFQKAYRNVYRVAEKSGPGVLLVDCPWYRGSEHLLHTYRRVKFGHFPDASWVLNFDGSLVNRPEVRRES